MARTFSLLIPLLIFLLDLRPHREISSRVAIHKPIFYLYHFTIKSRKISNIRYRFPNILENYEKEIFASVEFDRRSDLEVIARNFHYAEYNPEVSR